MVVQVDKMKFTTAHAFLSDRVGSGMLRHRQDAYCTTVIVNSSVADLSVGYFWRVL